MSEPRTNEHPQEHRRALLSQAATWLVTLILLVEAPDRLGTEGFGALSFATAYMLFFTLVAGLGTSTLLTREIARDHSLLPTYTYNAYVLKLLLASALSVVAIGLSLVDGSRTHDGHPHRHRAAGACSP